MKRVTPKPSRNGHHSGSMPHENVRQFRSDLPKDLTAERRLISSLMLLPGAMETVALPDADDFLDPANRITFSLLVALHQEREQIDAGSVYGLAEKRGHLKTIGGEQRLLELMEELPHGAHAATYAKLVREKAIRRRLVLKADAARAVAADEQVEIADVMAYFDGLGVGCDAELQDPFPTFNGAELDQLDTELVYLCEWVLVKGQQCVIGGTKKSLKTNVAVDLNLSLGIGSRFLGVFPVPRAVRTTLISGESGAHIIKETARRIARSKGLRLDNFTDSLFCFDLPILDSPAKLAALERYILQRQLQVVILDPAYLTLPMAENASNLFVAGAVLKGLGEIGRRSGATICIVHHCRKSTSQSFEPAELDDLSQSGFAEWARQWLLLNRRTRFDPDAPGDHQLWLSAGGSAGHCGLWGLDIREGSHQDEGGRRWEVDVRKAGAVIAEVVADEVDKKRGAKEQKAQATRKANREKVVEAFRLFPDGETKTCIQETAGLRSDYFGPVFGDLLHEKAIEPCKVLKNNRRCDGWRLVRNTGTTTPEQVSS